MTPATAVAGLPMYDLAELRAATDGWWQGLAEAFRRHGLRPVPTRLARELAPETLWRAPDLLFAQTCGYPLTHGLAGAVQLVATPCYAAPGCDGPAYRSLIVVREGDPATTLADCRGRIAAINGWASQSGWNVLRAMVAPFAERFFERIVVSGTHARSLALVASGEADLAAIDGVTHALLARHRPAALAGTRVLAPTPAAPGLPYVTAAGHDPGTVARLRAGLADALADPELAACRDALLLAGAEVLPLAAYAPIVAMAELGLGSR